MTAELAKVAQRPDLKETAARVLDEAVGVLADDDPQTRSGSRPQRGIQEKSKRSSVDIRLADSLAKDAKESGDAAADPLAAIAALPPGAPDQGSG